MFPSASKYEAKDWINVQLPHDGLIAATASQKACPGGCSGKSFIPRHVLWYRKKFVIPSDWKGQMPETLIAKLFSFCLMLELTHVLLSTHGLMMLNASSTEFYAFVIGKYFPTHRENNDTNFGKPVERLSLSDGFRCESYAQRKFILNKAFGTTFIHSCNHIFHFFPHLLPQVPLFGWTSKAPSATQPSGSTVYSRPITCAVTRPSD